jgi:hypothetical protein
MKKHISPYHLAVIHAGLGEIDAAVTELCKTYDDRSEALLWLKADPRLGNLRSDSRFIDLVEKVGL